MLACFVPTGPGDTLLAVGRVGTGVVGALSGALVLCGTRPVGMGASGDARATRSPPDDCERGGELRGLLPTSRAAPSIASPAVAAAGIWSWMVRQGKGSTAPTSPDVTVISQQIVLQLLVGQSFY